MLTIVKTLRLVFGLAVIWLGMVVLMFWQTIFHDEAATADQHLQTMSSLLGLRPDELTVSRSYQAPPTWAGDYTHAFCLSLKAPVAAEGFTPGDSVDEPTREAIEFAADAADTEVSWIPTAATLLTSDYQLRHLASGSQSRHIAWIEPGGETACFVAIKF